MSSNKNNRSWKKIFIFKEDKDTVFYDSNSLIVRNEFIKVNIMTKFDRKNYANIQSIENTLFIYCKDKIVKSTSTIYTSKNNKSNQIDTVKTYDTTFAFSREIINYFCNENF